MQRKVLIVLLHQGELYYYKIWLPSPLKSNIGQFLRVRSESRQAEVKVDLRTLSNDNTTL